MIKFTRYWSKFYQMHEPKRWISVRICLTLKYFKQTCPCARCNWQTDISLAYVINIILLPLSLLAGWGIHGNGSLLPIEVARLGSTAIRVMNLSGPSVRPVFSIVWEGVGGQVPRLLAHAGHLLGFMSCSMPCPGWHPKSIKSHSVLDHRYIPEDYKPCGQFTESCAPWTTHRMYERQRTGRRDGKQRIKRNLER